MFYQTLCDQKSFLIYYKISKYIINISSWNFILKSNLREFFHNVLIDIKKSSFTLKESSFKFMLEK